MIPISLNWNSRERSVVIKWNGFFSFGREDGKTLKKVLGISIPFGPRPQKIHPPRMRWVYVKEAISFLKEWKIKRVEGTFSFPDPMVNGILYGWMSTIGVDKGDRKANLTINFLGGNWCTGEATISPKILFYHLKKWILPLAREMRRKETAKRR